MVSSTNLSYKEFLKFCLPTRSRFEVFCGKEFVWSLDFVKNLLEFVFGHKITGLGQTCIYTTKYTTQRAKAICSIEYPSWPAIVP